MIAATGRARVIRGFSVAGNDPIISCLQFTGDTLVFCDANEGQVKSVKATFLCFEAKRKFLQEWVDWFKSSGSLVGAIGEDFGVQHGSLPACYLALPLCLWSAKRLLWSLVVERVERTPLAWNANYLSLGGRMTPMRSVLSNLPVYYMPIFKCPISVVNRIEKLQQDFFVEWQKFRKEVSFVRLGISV